jgi:hypothetical protein
MKNKISGIDVPMGKEAKYDKASKVIYGGKLSKNKKQKKQKKHKKGCMGKKIEKGIVESL